jgi:predicted transcriptional regulator YdeE
MKRKKTTLTIAIILIITMIAMFTSCGSAAEETEILETPRIVNVYREIMPATRFIGIKHTNEDRSECGGFGNQWAWMFEQGHFNTLRALLPEVPVEFFRDIDATIGLMRVVEGEPFQYWIGMFLTPYTEVPEGFDYIDFPRSELGVVWVYGQAPDIFWQCELEHQALIDYGVDLRPNELGEFWFFERYVCPRFTTPNEYGNIILDKVHFIVHCGRCGRDCVMYEGD